MRFKRRIEAWAKKVRCAIKYKGRAEDRSESVSVTHYSVFAAESNANAAKRNPKRLALRKQYPIKVIQLLKALLRSKDGLMPLCLQRSQPTQRTRLHSRATIQALKLQLCKLPRTVLCRQTLWTNPRYASKSSAKRKSLVAIWRVDSRGRYSANQERWAERNIMTSGSKCYPSHRTEDCRS